jgi:hypothetical protein
MSRRFVIKCLVLCLALLPALVARADFLQLSSVSADSFSGSLGGVGVTGSLVVNTATYYQWDAPVPGASAGYSDSVIDGQSPQYSYSGIYWPSTPLTDQIGYTQFSGETGSATATITFASAITDPVFEVANLDSTQIDFSPTSGLNGLQLLSGNGGADGDGFAVTGDIVSDGMPNTQAAQSITQQPYVDGTPRSAYGAVELIGTFTTLSFDVTEAATNGDGDGGSYTFATSPVPLPSPWQSCLLVFAGLFAFRRLRGHCWMKLARD